MYEIISCGLVFVSLLKSEGLSCCVCARQVWPEVLLKDRQGGCLDYIRICFLLKKDDRVLVTMSTSIHVFIVTHKQTDK